MRIAHVLLTVLLLLPTLTWADSFEDLAEARKISDEAVSLFAEEQIAEGYNLFKAYWPLPAGEVDDLIEQTRSQWPIISSRFGKSLGVEFIKVQTAGESLARYIYIQKFERHAIRWVLTFYKPDDRWYFNAIFFDDRIGELFEED